MTNTKPWKVGSEHLALGSRSRLVGILNVTPDSFSDGGKYISTQLAVKRALEMLEEGASVIDVGGESTRPGFEQIGAKVEISRVIPVIEDILDQCPSCIISIDTSKAAVAEAALSAGAIVLNDVWGLQKDDEIASVVAAHSAGVVLMRNGRDGETHGSVLDRIRASWEASLQLAIEAGVNEASIVLDPGVGFGTTRQEDLEILRGLELLRSFGYPIMLGTSRKRITALADDLPLEKRLESTLATTVAGVAAGIELFRVHDVAENMRAVNMADLIFRGVTS